MSSHRVRSHSADTKKAREPRRLTEKIAIMKRKEHEQSEAFEKAMKSIMEMQMARVHGGGGSMPSLQAIDSNAEYPASTIDLQSIYRDFDEVQRTSACSDRTTRVHSAGSASSRHLENQSHSFELDPYPVVGSRHQQWNSHKSDSDLQQSLLFSQQPQMNANSGQHMISAMNHLRTTYTSPGIVASNNKQQNTCSPTFSSVDQFHNQDLSPEPSLGASGGGSLPDLTNVEFSCGLDVPLEKDDEQSPVNRAPFQPPSRGSGPSKLMYSLSPRPTSPTMMYSPVDQHCLPGQRLGSHANSVPYNKHGAVHTPASLDGMQKSLTMPDFSSARVPSLHHSSSSSAFPVHQYGSVSPQHKAGFLHTESLPNFSRSLSSEPPPVTIIIDSPFADSSVSIGGAVAGSAERSQASLCRTHSAATSGISCGASRGGCIGGSIATTGAMGGGSVGMSGGNRFSCTVGIGGGNGISGIGAGHGNASGNSVDMGGGSRMPFSLGSDLQQQQHTPFFIGHPSNTLPVLPSYLEARQQQTLQQRFASISMTKTDIIRSYSEENLQKIPKEKIDLIQQNPFMGNLANANSVPCVYVESPNNDIQRYKNDSPVAVDSPSTTASYASSPPSVRPYWIDQPGNVGAFVFNEWPVEATGDRGKGGSPLCHHRSLTDLSTIPEAGETSMSNRRISLIHQLSLPSIALSDLAMDEHMDKQGCLLQLTPPDFEMEEEVVESLLKEQLPAFDVSSFLAAQRP